MEKKKIAFVISSMSAGGAERVVSILCNHLVNRFDIHIIMMCQKPLFYNLHQDITLLYCSKEPSPSKNFFEALKSNYALSKAIIGFIKEHRIDLCIGFMTPNNILATIAAKRCRIPVIISERNNPYLDTNTLNVFWKTLRRLLYPMANALVVQTEPIKMFYINFIQSEKLVTIPNPINPDFTPSNTTVKENIVLNVASLTNQKGQDTLIRAFAKTKLSGWKLHIIGEGKNREKLQQLIEKLKMEKHISLLGRYSDVATFYNKSKIFAFSSLYEGFPNALQEAMFFGLACVSTDCATGPAEMIEEGKSGFLVPVGNEVAITERLNLLMENDLLRTSMGQEAQKVMKAYEIDEILGKWIRIIDNLIP